MDFEDFVDQILEGVKWDAEHPEEAAGRGEIEWAADCLSKGVDPREIEGRREQTNEVWAAADQVSAAVENLAGGVAAELAGDVPVQPLGTVADRRVELDRAFQRFDAALAPAAPEGVG